MPSDLASFLYGTLGGSVAAIAGVKLLGEWFVQHRLAKAIKDHEARLAEKADVLKTQLSIYAHEQNTAVARVDSQRAKSLHAIYATIRAWSTPVTTLVAGSPLRNVDDNKHLDLYFKLCEEAHSAAASLFAALANNAIYVDSDLYAELSDLTSICGLSVAEVLVPMRQGKAEGWPSSQIYAETERQRLVFVETYKSKIQPMLQSVTARFREVLGVQRA